MDEKRILEACFSLAEELMWEKDNRHWTGSRNTSKNFLK